MSAPMVTWNMQGGNDTLDNKWFKYVKQLVSKYTYVCLQECGNIPDSIKRETPQPPPNAWPRWLNTQPPQNLKVDYVVWNLKSEGRDPVLVYILWAETDVNGHRVNLAVCSKMGPDELIYVPPGLANGNSRPSIGLHVNPDHVYTLHGLSGSGNDTPGLITTISTSNSLLPWYALGDYNREPQTWTPPAGVICPPDRPTQQSGGMLDYMVQFGNLVEIGKAQPEGPIWSDHAFVVFGTSNGTSNIPNSTQTVVKLKCLGDVDGPRFLDGRTGDGSVGLAPSTDGFSGTKWELSVVNDAITFKCLGDVDGPRFLDGRTGDGSVGLALTADTNPGGDLSGTRWGLSTVSAEAATVECFGSSPGPKFLDGRTGDGTVGLAPNTDGLSGTKWEITPF